MDKGDDVCKFVWLSAGFDSWLTRCLSSSSSYSSWPGKSDVYNSDIYAAARVEYSFVQCHFLPFFLFFVMTVEELLA
jgi:hypothetical protein